MIPPLPPPEELAALEASTAVPPVASTSTQLPQSTTESSAEAEGDAPVPSEGVSKEGEAPRVVPVKNGDWEAVWSAPSNAYYFWNSKSNETTWENPFSAAAAPTTTAQPPLPTEDDRFDGIDPDLAYLDPKYSTATSSASASYAPTFQARFNSRTGRFQGDPTINPDRVSEFKRGERQQEAFYDTNSWTESLGGKGLRAARGIGGSTNEEGVQTKQKRPSAKQVEKFKANKATKKANKLKAWLAD